MLFISLYCIQTWPYGVLYDTTPVFPDMYTSKKVNAQEKWWIVRREYLYLTTLFREKKLPSALPSRQNAFKVIEWH